MSESNQTSPSDSEMNRRRFLLITGAGALGTLALGPIADAGSSEKASTGEPWYKRAYRRNVIDMHITDSRPEFLTLFDAGRYAELLAQAQVQSAVVYAHSHVGLCYFPTQVGKAHPAYVGKDTLARLIEALHERDVAVVLYYSLIYNTWAYREHEDWKVRRPDGEGTAEGSRYGVCCPNSPYRDHAAAQAKEICDLYDFEGMRFDMTFWPGVCYCQHCAVRFDREVGGELPRTIHWEDTKWVAFQRKREEWLVEFAALMTKTVKMAKPSATVEHQASTYTANWRFGVTYPLAPQNDFLQGDFYGDQIQGSFVRKLFQNLSPNQPYGFETSVMANLRNHTAIKPEPLLVAKSAACLADGGAFVFIDSIDPAGTLNPEVYRTMGSVFEATKNYELHLGGVPVQDVAIYLSTESKFDFAHNGKDVQSGGLDGAPHVDAAVSVCKTFIQHHIPYGVLAKNSLDQLSRYKILVLPNVLMMDAEEVEAIRKYVEAGGCLYASKYTSLTDKQGNRQSDFMLADLFGVSHRDRTKENYTYIAPSETAKDLLSPYSPERPLGLETGQFIVEAQPGTEVLGRIVLPYTDPGDGNEFASIHSNPPGISTDHPALVRREFGKGRVLYCTHDLESEELYREIFVRLIRSLHDDFAFEVEAPGSVEATLFHQPDRKRYLLSLVNFQKDLPNIPVHSIQVRVQVVEEGVNRVSLLPEGTSIEFTKKSDRIVFTVPKLETLAMFAIEYS